MNDQKVKHFARGAAALYDPHADIDATVDSMFHDDAKFRDPIAQVTGKRNIKAQFSMIKPFLKRADVHVIHAAPVDEHVIAVTADITYFWRFVPEFLHTKLRIVTHLYLDANDNKVTEGDSVWDVASLIQSVPVVACFYNKFRIVNGHVSSKIVNTIGMGARKSREKGETLGGKVSGVASGIQHEVMDKYEDAKDYAAQGAQYAKSVVSEASERTKQKAQQMEEEGSAMKDRATTSRTHGRDVTVGRH